MPGTPMEENSNKLEKLRDEERRPNENNYEPVVREITQTDRLNRRLLMSLLNRMNKSDGEFDKFMEKDKIPSESQEDGDF